MTLSLAYRSTAYMVGPIAVRIGRRSKAIERLLNGRPGGFVTAWNPWSRRTPEGINQRAQRALLQRVRRLPHWVGVGRGRTWSEAHILVQAHPRVIIRLGRQYRQNAIVLVTPPRPARLRTLAEFG